MIRYVNYWTALCAWVVLIAVVWVFFVPGTVSLARSSVLAVTGPLMAFVLSMVWRSQKPAPSIGQQRVQVEEAEIKSRAKV